MFLFYFYTLVTNGVKIIELIQMVLCVFSYNMMCYALDDFPVYYWNNVRNEKPRVGSHPVRSIYVLFIQFDDI